MKIVPLLDDEVLEKGAVVNIFSFIRFLNTWFLTYATSAFIE